MRLTLIYIIILLMTTISLPAQIIKTVVGTTCGIVATADWRLVHGQASIGNSIASTALMHGRWA
jgi:hypothetical protein